MILDRFPATSIDETFPRAPRTVSPCGARLCPNCGDYHNGNGTYCSRHCKAEARLLRDITNAELVAMSGLSDDEFDTTIDRMAEDSERFDGQE